MSPNLADRLIFVMEQGATIEAALVATSGATDSGINTVEVLFVDRFSVI